ncbi:MAG: C-terminal binding protein [Trueperaceae bacterium]
MTHEPTRRAVVWGPGYDTYDLELETLRPFGVARIEHVPTADAEHAAALRDADVIFVREGQLGADLIDTLGRCRIIVRYGIGVDNIDLKRAAERRIYVANVPTYGTDDVATQALALLLAVLRDVPRRDTAVRAGDWGTPRQRRSRLHDFRLGLVGFGRIGRRFRELLLPFGVLETLVVDPALETGDDEGVKATRGAAGEEAPQGAARSASPSSIVPEGVRLVDLATLCREADVISLHAPATTATYHVLDAATIGLMKPGTIVINTARGALVDEEALARALREGKLLGAGLDVFEREPPDADNPLLPLDNVVVSDHHGWYSEDAVVELQRGAAEEAARVLAGGEPIAWVNRWTS